MKFLSILMISTFLLLGNLRAATEIEQLSALEAADLAVQTINIKSESPIADLDENLANFQGLIKTFNQLKSFNIEYVKGLLQKIKNGDVLSGAELFNLRHIINTFNNINNKILDFSKIYSVNRFRASKAFTLKFKDNELLKAQLIWLSGHLLVLDHMEDMNSLFLESNPDFRRIAKNTIIENPSRSKHYDKILDSIVEVAKYTIKIGESNKFLKSVKLATNMQDLLKTKLGEDEASLFLLENITQNKTTKSIMEGQKDFQMTRHKYIDSVVAIYQLAFGKVVSFFGNIAGSIKWRKGHLYNNAPALEMAMVNLQPMDILLEKTPFALTDKLIPGHYGHAAIYLGTKEQLTQIGMWNHPSIVPFQNQIEEGKIILEAIRPGVHLATLEEFMNIDELTIISKKNGLSNLDLVSTEITRGMDQIGKKYDFNFDVTTLDKIVCSELIFIAFGNTHWPTKYRDGRVTITPDDIAEILFQKNSPFEMKSLMVANKNKDKIDLVTLDYIAPELGYELRASDGTVVKDPSDPTNTYWKKETKCTKIRSGHGLNIFKKRECETTYKETYYEEWSNI